MITYPVDVANTRWAVVRISTGEILKHNQKWPREDGAEIVGLDPDVALLLEVETAKPAYDPATERLEAAAPVTDIPNNTHTHSWNVVARPQADIDADVELQQAKALYQDLKNHVGTTAERATRLENVVAYMLKNQYGAS